MSISTNILQGEVQCDGEADEDLEEGAEDGVAARDDGAHLRVREEPHRGAAQQPPEEHQDAQQCRPDGG